MDEMYPATSFDSPQMSSLDDEEAAVVLSPAAPRPLLPAWARLLIYIPTVAVVAVVGNVAGSIPGVLYVMSNTGLAPTVILGNPDAAAELVAAIPPWGIVLMQYSTYLPVAVVTLLFARLLDRRN